MLFDTVTSQVLPIVYSNHCIRRTTSFASGVVGMGIAMVKRDLDGFPSIVMSIINLGR